jgi:hypothetical protein
MSSLYLLSLADSLCKHYKERQQGEASYLDEVWGNSLLTLLPISDQNADMTPAPKPNFLRRLRALKANNPHLFVARVAGVRG